MRKSCIYISHLSYTYENTIEPLFKALSVQFESGWTGIVGSNGSGKTTLLKLLTGVLRPDSGTLPTIHPTHYCPQCTSEMPEALAAFLSCYDSHALSLRKRLQLREDWQYRWHTLSEGERKRCQIAVALYENPVLLAVDEPSNHLDIQARQILFEALRSYKGVGLLVSHDRELLNELCHHTLFLDPPQADMRKGNYQQAAEEIAREKEEQALQYDLLQRKMKGLKKEVLHRKEQSRRARKRLSKSKIAPNDHDAKAKKNLARLTGKDAVDGKISNRLETRLNKMLAQQQSLRIQKMYTLGINFNERQSAEKFPLYIDNEILPLGKDKSLAFPDLMLCKGERIGIVGDNGSGKTTFLNHLIQKIRLPDEQLIYIPQEISSDYAEQIHHRIMQQSDEKRGKLLALVSRLGSTPKRLLDTCLPSPGETRKLLIAEGLMRDPALIVMDEPTNHMDLPSMRCLEDALQASVCTLILVSHDSVFLQQLVSCYWQIKAKRIREYQLVVR